MAFIWFDCVSVAPHMQCFDLRPTFGNPSTRWMSGF